MNIFAELGGERLLALFADISSLFRRAAAPFLVFVLSLVFRREE